ncbi:MAG: hypothetical protein B6D62_00570 [Candidatus Cloacimonas sp. 4484_275]|nr:MAG: hypothetical protein B6D62_00570 [Candidatus Cloacimonas sp. 4484_275]RLC50367.1 MAG: hypothetical protein DRZ79_04510 [Candidatus Cloacimonadota bacterium]
MKKNSVNLFIGIILGIIFLFLWIKIVDWREFFHYFSNFNLKFALLFSVFYVFAYFLRSLRWRLILFPIKKLSVGNAFMIFMNGLLINYLIPIRAGEIAKSIILKIKYNVRISRSLPTIFIDKITDLFPIILIMILIPLISVRLNTALFSIVVVLFLIFLFFIGFLFFSVNHQSLALKFLHTLLRIFPKKYRSAFENFFSQFVEGMAIMKNRYRDVLLISLLTIFAVFSEAVYIFAVFKAFGANIGFIKILFGYTLMNLTYILPTPPAQIGSNQFMWVLIFSFALGVDENLTSAAIAFSHLLTSVWIFLLGGISLLALNIKFSDLVTRKNWKTEGVK